MDSRRPAVALAVMAFVAAPASAGAATNQIAPVAGNGTPGAGGDNGPATSAQLNAPFAAVPVAGGGFVIADANNNRIRRVAADGTITTIAGDGTVGAGGDNGPATSAQLNNPIDVAIMPDGAVLVADSNNNKIRRIGTDGNITTVAGTGAPTSTGDEGPATDATLNFPAGVAVAADGTFFIAENDGHRIRGVTPDGKIHTYAGNGVQGGAGDGGFATAANLSGPSDVALMADGSMLIVELDGNRVRRVGLDTKISRVAGSAAGTPGFAGDNGPATSAQLNEPHKVAVAGDGSFLIADRNNNRIRRVASDGTITTVAGNGTPGGGGDGGLATAAELSGPLGVSVDAEGDYLVADTFNHRIRKVDAADPPPGDPDPDPPPLPPPPPEPQDAPPVARITANPNPTCTGVPTQFDARGSTPGSSPIVNYRFEYTEYYTSAPNGTPLSQRRVISDDSSSVATTSFSWNRFTAVRSWFDASPTRDDVFMELTVTDANGLTDETGIEVGFVQGNTQESRAGCPSSPLSEDLKPLVIPSTVFHHLTVTKQTVAVPLPCKGEWFGLAWDPRTRQLREEYREIDCFGSMTGFAKTLAASAGNRRLRRARIFEGAVSVPVGERGKVRARLTRRGKRLFRREGSVRTRILFRMFTPTGELTKTARTRTLKRKKARN